LSWQIEQEATYIVVVPGTVIPDEVKVPGEVGFCPIAMALDVLQDRQQVHWVLDD
jgi:hypothetical protein